MLVLLLNNSNQNHAYQTKKVVKVASNNDKTNVKPIIIYK